MNNPTENSKIIPLTPQASPLEDNPNHWQVHNAQSNLKRMHLPIEVEYDDHGRQIIRNPKMMIEMQLKRVVFWRPHRELEKMPYYLKFEWHRKFSFWDRVRIMFGGRNLLVPMAVACRHNPGASQPVAIGYLTKQATLDGVMNEQRDLALKRFLAEKAQEVK
jgi:hypothetical protein